MHGWKNSMEIMLYMVTTTTETEALPKQKRNRSVLRFHHEQFGIFFMRFIPF